MGHTIATIAKIKLYNPYDLSKCLDLELLVDTGSMYTWIKRGRLERLGIRPTGRRRFRTIENRIIEREIGEAVIECLGERATTIVVFAEDAEDKDAEVLGVYSLEGLRLEIDPVTKQLRKIEALLAL